MDIDEDKIENQAELKGDEAQILESAKGLTVEDMGEEPEPQPLEQEPIQMAE